MGEVVEFPGFDERLWREIQFGFANILKRSSVPEEGVAWILSETRRRVDEAIPSLRTSVSVPALADASPQQVEAASIAMKATQEYFSALILGLTGQLVVALCELYMSQSNGAPPTREMKAQIVELIPGGKDKDKS